MVARVIRSQFVHNGGDDCLAGGGVLLVSNHSSPDPMVALFEDCVWMHNWVGDAGGGIALLHQACCNLTNCLFVNNTAAGVVRGGGAIYTQSLPTSWAYNCSFFNNRCPSTGGLRAPPPSPPSPIPPSASIPPSAPSTWGLVPPPTTPSPRYPPHLPIYPSRRLADGGGWGMGGDGGGWGGWGGGCGGDSVQKQC